MGRTHLLLLLLLPIIALAMPPLSSPSTELFAAFKAKFNVAYRSPAEEMKRYAIFSANLPLIRSLEQAERKPGVYGITRFADRTPEEFASTRFGRKASTPRADIPVAKPRSSNVNDLPKEIDWHSLGGTTKIYDQGECGSCWAFSATEQIESMWWVKHRNQTIRSLSPQQIVDCDHSGGDDGCNGGDTPTAYEYVMKQGGLEYWADYPYEGEDEKCHWNVSDIGARVKSWSYVTKSKNETEMLQYVGTTAPVSICVDAITWLFYIGGVIEHFCGPNKKKDLDHCVQIVGYGDDILGTPYWLIRNSWGELWGELGYLKVVRGKNLCGVADEVTTVDVHEND